MKLIIRQEKPQDYQQVETIIQSAFKTEPLSDQSEHRLVARLRGSQAFIPELSLVAEFDNQIIGYVLLTKIQIVSETDVFDSLALAPIAVSPQHQRKGIGSKLMHEAHGIAKGLGHSSIVLLGHENYYPRFGYELTSNFGITLPFEAPEVNCMIKPLYENSLAGVRGMVQYAPEFMEK